MRFSLLCLLLSICMANSCIECNAIEIIGKSGIKNSRIVSVNDLKGNSWSSKVNPEDSTYSLSIESEKPEIMTFFLTYNDDMGEKRQMYSPILIKESESPILIDVYERNGHPVIASEEINQNSLLSFTDFLVENLRSQQPGGEDNLIEKINNKIKELKNQANDSLVKDYLDLWGRSSGLSVERMRHMRSDLDPATKKSTMPKHDISLQELIENKATKYFPEFTNIVISQVGKGESLTEKVMNLRENIPQGELLEYIERNVISNYINLNKGKQPTEILLAQLESVGKNYPDYDEWVMAVNGYKSYLKKGDDAPEDKLISPDGSEFYLSDFKGKYIFIDFWASWCTYCIKEFPALEKVKEAMADSDIQFIGISLDEEVENWKKAMQKYNLNDTQFMVSSPDLANKLGLSSIPRYMIYDKEGKMLYSETPRPRQTEQLIDLLKSLN